MIRCVLPAAYLLRAGSLDADEGAAYLAALSRADLDALATHLNALGLRIAMAAVVAELERRDAVADDEARSEAMAERQTCCRCHEPATLELRPGGFDRWTPYCRDCASEEHATCDEIAQHEMDRFGGAYGVPTIEQRPLALRVDVDSHDDDCAADGGPRVACTCWDDAVVYGDGGVA